MNNIIDVYLDFKKKMLQDYVFMILPHVNDDFSLDVIHQLIDTYMISYYFYSFQTLDDVEIVNFETLIKEFEGKRLEIIYNISKNNTYDKYIASVDMCYVGVVTAFSFDYMKKDPSKELISQILDTNLKRIDVRYDQQLVDCLYEKISFYRKTVSRFLKYIDNEDFFIDYKQYRHNDDKYYINLCQSVGQLNVYPELALSKNFNNERVSIMKLRSILNLLSLDILYRINSNEKLDYYFVDLSLAVLDCKEQIYDILSIVSNYFICQHVVFVVQYDDYQNHKRILNSIGGDYSLAIAVDMSRVREISQKLDVIDQIELFQYIILNNVKSKDYDSAMKYKSVTGKKIFFHEFVEE